MSPLRWTIVLGVIVSVSCSRTFPPGAALAPSISNTSIDAASSLASVAASSQLSANDCRNVEAVVSNLDTSFLASQLSAAVGAVTVAYRRFGPLESLLGISRQRPLVLIIGIGCTMHDWTPRLLRALAAHREVIILDNAGIGFSEVAASGTPAAAEYFKFQAATVAGLIDALKLTQQPDVLGWSLGAKIALHVAVFHGSSMHTLISVAGSAGGTNSSTAVLDAVDLTLPISNRLAKAGALLERPANIHAVCQWLLETSTMPRDPITGEQLRAQVDAEEAYHVGEGIVPLLPSVKNPALIITASNDLTNPPSNQGPIVEGIPGSVLVTFSGCGHLVLFQEVDQFVKLVDSFTAASGSFTPMPTWYYRCTGDGISN